MKTIAVLLIAFLYNINTFSQQIPLSDWAAHTLPTGTEKLTKEQLISFAKENNFVIDGLENNPEHTYKYENIFFAFYDLKGKYPDDYLVKNEHSFNLFFKKNHQHSSFIKSFKNYEVIMMKHENSKQIVTYRFLSINQNKTQIFNGIIMCKKEDANEAQKIISDIVEHIPFDN